MGLGSVVAVLSTVGEAARVGTAVSVLAGCGVDVAAGSGVNVFVGTAVCGASCTQATREIAKNKITSKFRERINDLLPFSCVESDGKLTIFPPICTNIFQ